MNKREINVQTKKETVIELTAEEVAAKESKEIEVQAQQKAEADAKTASDVKLASGKAKLKELGLDDDELKQILGI